MKLLNLSEAKNPVSLYKKAVEVLGKMEKNFDNALGNNPYDYFDGNVDTSLDKTKFEKRAQEFSDKAKGLLETMTVASALYVLAQSKSGVSTVDEKELDSLIQILLQTQEDQKEAIEHDLSYGTLDDTDHVTSTSYESLIFDINNPLVGEVEAKAQEALRSNNLTLSKQEFDQFFSGDFEQSSTVGNCYLVAALHGMASSPLFELMIRSSVKRLSNGEWEVKIPLMSESSEIVTISQADVDNSMLWIFGKKVPLTGNEGIRVLEAAYMKSKFGSVDRKKSEGGFTDEALQRLGGDNFRRIKLSSSRRNPDGTMKIFEKDGEEYADSTTLDQLSEVEKGDLYYFLMRYHKSGYIAGAYSKSEKDLGVLSSVFGSYKAKNSFDFYVPQHAYSIVDIDPDKQIIVLANPWDTEDSFNLTFREFEENFETISGVKIDHENVLRNINGILKK